MKARKPASMSALPGTMAMRMAAGATTWPAPAAWLLLRTGGGVAAPVAPPVALVAAAAVLPAAAVPVESAAVPEETSPAVPALTPAPLAVVAAGLFPGDERTT